MRHPWQSLPTLLYLSLFLVSTSLSRATEQIRLSSDHDLDHDLPQDEAPTPVSLHLFSSLERMSRLVDIAYCVGNTGVSEPFSCISRCKEFPTLTLATTWNTGMLMSDSCGYIAVDHGKLRANTDKTDGEDDPLSEEAIIVAFRGTYSITNTVIDLSTVPQKYVPYPSPDDGGEEQPADPQHRCDNCTVHSGFLESWRQARKLVLPELQKLREEHPTYPVHLVGHSLGGAVAMLAALELKVSLGWEDTTVTTFGEPKVGNQELADYVDAVFELCGRTCLDEKDPERRTYRRVTHAEDPVPLLPLSEWGYRSHGGEFFISKKNLSPALEDVVACHGDRDSQCIAQGDVLLDERGAVAAAANEAKGKMAGRSMTIPSRFRLWQLFFAHRDYFWRIGLCVPGGDPANWGREKYGQGEEGEALLVDGL